MHAKKWLLPIITTVLFLFHCPIASLAEDRSTAPPPLEEIASLFENLLPDRTFIDMKDHELSAVTASISEYYDFIGRVSEDDKYSFILGRANSGDNPLAGMAIRFSDAIGFVELDSVDDGPIDYVLPGIKSLETDWKYDFLFIEPGYRRGDLRFAAMLYCQNPERGAELLKDCVKRGVVLDAPLEKPYAEIRMLQNGSYRTEYFALDPALVADFSNQKGVSPDSVGRVYFSGRSSVHYVADGDENLEAGVVEARPVPESLIALAIEKCGYQLPNQAAIKGIVKAHLIVSLPFGLGEAEQTITDPVHLLELEKLISEAKLSSIGKDYYAGILTLTLKDGSQVQLHKAIHESDGIILGSHAPYALGPEANAAFWSIFDQCIIEY